MENPSQSNQPEKNESLEFYEEKLEKLEKEQAELHKRIGLREDFSRVKSSKIVDMVALKYKLYKYRDMNDILERKRRMFKMINQLEDDVALSKINLELDPAYDTALDIEYDFGGLDIDKMIKKMPDIETYIELENKIDIIKENILKIKTSNK